MTEENLKLELECYKIYINPDCDINNMTTKEVEEFFKFYKESETYQKGLITGVASISDQEILELIKDLELDNRACINKQTK